MKDLGAEDSGSYPVEWRSGDVIKLYSSDSPNQNRFPNTVLRPGERYHSETQFRFYFK